MVTGKSHIIQASVLLTHVPSKNVSHHNMTVSMMHAAKTNGNVSEQAISELIEFVQANSPYYAHTWRDIKGDGISLSDIPVVDHASFWESNTCRNSKVVTSQQTDGIIFKTGGKSMTRPNLRVADPSEHY